MLDASGGAPITWLCAPAVPVPKKDIHRTAASLSHLVMIFSTLTVCANLRRLMGDDTMAASGATARSPR
jgi:hypothetical protein